ncbi:MAG: hypothetical protein O2971_20355 [Proteobacteria bacterium]|nr:hypothetical protein [Pseudomonadota bacterium]
MQTSSRLYQCARCHAQVIICSRCDRGHRYCVDGCAQAARAESCKRAGKKYQSSRPGRFNNAARQQRFRARSNQKVTQQGSIKKRLRDLLATQLTRPEKTPMPWLSGTPLRCHHCGEVCDPFLRHDFLQSHRFKRSFRRSGTV